MFKLYFENLKKLIPILLIVVASSCSFFKPENKKLLAIAYDKELYRSDVEKVIPKGLGSYDSIKFVNQYVINWTKSQSLVHKAESYLNKTQQDFEFELNELYRELLIHNFNEQYSLDKLSKEISEDDISVFYNKHKEVFRSDDYYLKAHYIVIDRNHKSRIKLYKYLNSETSSDSLEFQNLCKESDIKVNNFEAKWITLKKITSVVPVEIKSPEFYFKGKKCVQLFYEDKVYLIKYDDYVFKGGISPLEFVKSKISDILFTKKKQNFVNDYQQKIYQKDLRNRNIIIYTN